MSDEQRRAALEAALAKTQGQSAGEQARAVEALMVEPSQPTADDLWEWLVKGLIVALVIALVGLIVLIAIGKSSDALLTAFTALLSGLIGLFVKTPGGGGGSGSQASSPGG
jgi:hypothetical protein